MIFLRHRTSTDAGKRFYEISDLYCAWVGNDLVVPWWSTDNNHKYCNESPGTLSVETKVDQQCIASVIMTVQGIYEDDIVNVHDILWWRHKIWISRFLRLAFIYYIYGVFLEDKWPNKWLDWIVSSSTFAILHPMKLNKIWHSVYSKIILWMVQTHVNENQTKVKMTNISGNCIIVKKIIRGTIIVINSIHRLPKLNTSH